MGYFRKLFVSGNEIINRRRGRNNLKYYYYVQPKHWLFCCERFISWLRVRVLSQDNQTSFSIMPTASYFIPTKSIIRPFAQAGIGYSVLKEDGNSYGGLAMGFGAGVALLASKNFSVDIGFQALRNDYDSYTMFTYGGAIGLSVYF